MWGTSQGMVYLATGNHDMRKSINELALVVAEALGYDAVGAHRFVFCNRGRARLTVLHWDRNGFWLHCRRSEQPAARARCTAWTRKRARSSTSFPPRRVEQDRQQRDAGLSPAAMPAPAPWPRS